MHLRPRQLASLPIPHARHRYRHTPNNPLHDSNFNVNLWLPRSCSGALNRAGYATVSSGSESSNADDAPEPKNPFPYPTHKNPTPHQIFHLPPGATQTQIKARYFDLVRTHHPDSHHASKLSASLAHARFRTIKASYDFLSGRTISPHPNARPTPEPKEFDPYMHELARRRRAYYAAQGRYREGDEEGPSGKAGWWEGFGPKGKEDNWKEDGWKERTILTLGVISLVAGLFPSVPSTLVSPFLPSSSSSSTPSSSATTSNSTIPSSFTSPPQTTTADQGTSFSLPFMDGDKNHRSAVSALAQALQDREEIGRERRESVKRRVREMAEADAGVSIGVGAGAGAGVKDNTIVVPSDLGPGPEQCGRTQS